MHGHTLALCSYQCTEVLHYKMHPTSSPASDGTQRDRKPVPVCVYAGQSQSQTNQWPEWTLWLCRGESLGWVRPGSHDLVAVPTQCRRRTHNQLELAPPQNSRVPSNEEWPTVCERVCVCVRAWVGGCISKLIELTCAALIKLKPRTWMQLRLWLFNNELLKHTCELQAFQ